MSVTELQASEAQVCTSVDSVHCTTSLPPRAHFVLCGRKRTIKEREENE